MHSTVHLLSKSTRTALTTSSRNAPRAQNTRWQLFVFHYRDVRHVVSEQKTDVLRHSHHSLRTRQTLEKNVMVDSDKDAAAYHRFLVAIHPFGALCTVEHAGNKEGDGIGSRLASTAIDSAIRQVVCKTARSMASQTEQQSCTAATQRDRLRRSERTVSSKALPRGCARALTKTTTPWPSGPRRRRRRFRLPCSRELGPTPTPGTDSRYTAQIALSTAFATETPGADGRPDAESVPLLRKRTPTAFLCPGNAELARAVGRSQNRVGTAAENACALHSERSTWTNCKKFLL